MSPWSEKKPSPSPKHTCAKHTNAAARAHFAFPACSVCQWPKFERFDVGNKERVRLNQQRLKTETKKKNHTTGELHPRNPHRVPYDFPRLIRACPELERFLRPHPLAGDTIDFSDPAAVKTLNRALLKFHYNVLKWDIPEGYLCPPIPSRADYLHYAADLLAEDASANIPRGPAVKVLDIGVGANCVYPLVGSHDYGWSFVGTDVDPVSVKWANQLIGANPSRRGKIECRVQPMTDAVFENVIRPGEAFALSICNPPFHASAAEAAAGTTRKLKNLGGGKPVKTVLNFGGQSHELWCHGGEAAFVRRMIVESATHPELCIWFTTLVSKQASLPEVERELKKARVLETRILTMFAGQKQSRVVAWTFLPPTQRRQRLDISGTQRVDAER